MLFQILPLEIENKIWFMHHQMCYAPVLLDILYCVACLQRRYQIIQHFPNDEYYALENICCKYLETTFITSRIKYRPSSWGYDNVQHDIGQSKNYYHNYLLELLFDKTHYKKKFVDILIENGINPSKYDTKKQLKIMLMKL